MHLSKKGNKKQKIKANFKANTLCQSHFLKKNSKTKFFLKFFNMTKVNKINKTSIQ